MIKRKVEYSAEEFGQAFREAVEANQLSYRDVMYICGKPERTAFKLIGGETLPDAAAIILLHTALYYGKRKMPRSLDRIKEWILFAPKSWAAKNSGEKLEHLGEAKQARKRYIYRGRKMNPVQIGAVSKRGVELVRYRLKTAGAQHGDDVTALIDSVWPRGAAAHKTRKRGDL